MPTDDERREVAARLRNMCSRGCRYAEEFYDLLNETVMHEWDFHSFQDVADRLADLIEPEEQTCLAECFPPGHERSLHQMVCSQCGALVFGPVMPEDDRGSMFRFCPNCGAKVVGE